MCRREAKIKAQDKADLFVKAFQWKGVGLHVIRSESRYKVVRPKFIKERGHMRLYLDIPSVQTEIGVFLDYQQSLLLPRQVRLFFANPERSATP